MCHDKLWALVLHLFAFVCIADALSMLQSTCEADVELLSFTIIKRMTIKQNHVLYLSKL